MTNIKDYPVLANPSDEDWLLIQENKTIPAYKKTQLINIKGSGGSSNGNSTLWSYRDGTLDFNVNASEKLFVDTPRDVLITLESLPGGTEIQIKRIRSDNSLFLTGISKIEGNDISINSSIKIPFSDIPSKLIYVNSELGWVFIPSLSVTVLSPLVLPSTGLIQLFNAANIVAGNEDKISQWDDEVSANNGMQNNINSQPKYIESIFAEGSIGGLLFEGSQEYETDLSYLENQKYVIAIVEARTSGNQIYAIGSTSGNTNSGLHVGYRGDTEFTLAQYGNDLDASIASYSGSLQPNIWIVSNSSRGKEIFKNGILISSNSNTDDLTEVNNGRIGSALGSFYQGYLGMLAVWIGDKMLSEVNDISNAINLTFGTY
ncbi:MAG: hypothetical protein AAF349_26730 [Cyanobacteria bacterium P01_A01_bin.68]